MWEGYQNKLNGWSNYIYIVYTPTCIGNKQEDILLTQFTIMRDNKL